MKIIIEKTLSPLVLYSGIIILERIKNVKIIQLKSVKRAQQLNQKLMEILAILRELEFRKGLLLAQLKRTLTWKQFLLYLIIYGLVDFSLGFIYGILAIIFFDEDIHAIGLKKIFFIKNVITSMFILYYPLKILILVLKIVYLQYKIINS